jgi:hypothetical protein
MNDILDFIDELNELQELYNTGELRNFDFQTKIQKYQRTVDAFEDSLEAQYQVFKEQFYTPVKEV